MAIVEDIQGRLDSYKTNKQRKARLKELKQFSDQHDGFVTLELAIEVGVLMLWLTGIKKTAKEMSDTMRDHAAAGTFPLSVNIDGQRLDIPPEKFRKPH